MKKLKGYDSQRVNMKESNFDHGGNVFTQAKKLNIIDLNKSS